jgi:hypothetical protein
MLRAAAWCVAKTCRRHAQSTVRELTSNAATGSAINPPTVVTTTVRKALQRRKALVAHTVYECGGCGERFIGERRCDACGLFCRALGLGGLCTECDTPILLDDLLGEGVGRHRLNPQRRANRYGHAALLAQSLDNLVPGHGNVSTGGRGGPRFWPRVSPPVAK